MLTKDILEKHTYWSTGGPIDAVPVSSVILFLNRIRDRISDVESDLVTFQSLDKEITDTIIEISKK
jgi:hypothetical protein